MRSSIEGDKDKALIREGLLAAKEGLLRDFARLVQVAGFERRAMERGEPWATCDDARWTVVDARRAFQRGAAAFEKLPKTEQEEIWQLFAAADPDNDGEVEEREMAELFGFAMGRGSRALAGYGAAVPGQGIIRLVDFDGRRAVTWPKFQAAILAASSEEPEALEGDLGRFYDQLSGDGGDMTVFALADGLQNLRIGLTSDDLSNLLYSRFDTSKPTLSRKEFTEWVLPYARFGEQAAA